MAFALPSRSESTVKAASWMTPSLRVTGAGAAVLRILISRTAGLPAVTVKESFTVA